MNPLNYCTLEAAQRLVDAGIVLETDMCWYFVNNKWFLETSGRDYEGNISIPAACFAEVWRELPCGTAAIHTFSMRGGHETLVTIDERTKGFSGVTYIPQIFKHNPTDAAIELLIWVVKGKKI